MIPVVPLFIGFMVPDNLLPLKSLLSFLLGVPTVFSVLVRPPSFLVSSHQMTLNT